MTNWTIANIPPQAGKLAVVTGATGGLGYQTAMQLAQAGAEVVLTGRNEAKGREAVSKIRSQFPDAKISFEALDLANLASVADFARRFATAHASLDLLINNAGVMALPTRQTTADGFEMQFGTNYLGHYALTAQLLPLQRRSDAAGWNLMSNASHPGWARTDLFANGPGFGLISFASQLAAPLFSQSAESGALPTLFAATSPQAEGGGYYGPNGLNELRGPPAPALIMPQASDKAAAGKLWDVSQQLTGVSFG
jgi:hypothetical protein